MVKKYMPRKTRHQKIITKTRVLSRAQQHALNIHNAESLAKNDTVSIFKSDFHRSLMVIGLIITLEIIVYFGTMYKYLR